MIRGFGAHGCRVIKDGVLKSLEKTHVDFVRRQLIGGAHDGVACKLDVMEVTTPFVLAIADNRCKYLGHRVVHTLNTAIPVRMVGVGDNLLFELEGHRCR